MPPSLIPVVEEFQYVMNAIPSDLNPYLEMAKYLEGVTKLTPFPTWAQWLQRVAILGFFIIFIQAVYLIYIRIKAKMFQSYSFNEIGFFRVDAASMSGIHLSIFAPITIAELIYENATGKVHFLVYGTKFILLVNVSLLFLWICASQCAMLHWNCVIRGQRPRNGRALRIVRFIMHLFLCCLLIWPIFIVWAFWTADHQLNSIKEILSTVNSRLLIAAPSFSPQSFHQIQIMQLCIPALQIVPHFELASSSIRMAVKAYLIIGVAASLLYIPFLIVSLRGLYICAKADKIFANQSMISTIDRILGSSSVYETTMRKRKLVVLHAISLYLMTLTYIPVLIWILSYDAHTFLRNPTWQLGARTGLHVPVSIVGNVLVFLVIYIARISYLETRMISLPSGTTSDIFEKPEVKEESQ